MDNVCMYVSIVYLLNICFCFLKISNVSMGNQL